MAGSASIAPYQSRPADSVSARVVLAPAGLLAIAPNGTTAAVADGAHGVCFVPVGSGPARVCAAIEMNGKKPVTADFSPDGRTLALGQGVSVRSGGTVALVDVATGAGRPLPPAVPSGAVESVYLEMTWNRSDGHLLLISGSRESSGPRTRLVDVDPVSLVSRVIAVATGAYEFQSGYFEAGGGSAVFTVYASNQIPPNLVVVNMATGTRKEFGVLGPSGTQLVPLAVAPDGRHAIVGFSTYGPSGPPLRLDLNTGTLTPIPGLTGDFALAAYSPDGTQLVSVTSFGGPTAGTSAGPSPALRVQMGPVDGAAITIGTVSNALPDKARLTWSAVDSLGITSPVAIPAGEVAGWSLK